MLRTRACRRAFTLMELLVVISVIMILMSLLLPAIQRARESANVVSCMNRLKQIGIAIHLYASTFDSFPTDYDQPISKFSFLLPPPFGAPSNSPDVPTEYYWPNFGATPPENMPIYAAVLPFIEQDVQVPTWRTDPQPVPTFLCPSRRGVAIGAKDDYCGAIHPAYYISSVRSVFGVSRFKRLGYCGGEPEWLSINFKLYDHNQEPPDPQPYIDAGWTFVGTETFDPPQYEIEPAVWFPFFEMRPDWKNKYAILGGHFFQSLSVRQVSDADGTSCTLLMAHKGKDPAYYNGLGQNDLGWWAVDNYLEHKRSFEVFARDQNHIVLKNYLGDRVVMYAEGMMMSPHTNTMPALAADGSVRNFGFSMSPETLFRAWAYNDGEILDLDAPGPGAPYAGPPPPGTTMGQQ